ncbi:cupin domain-containing protein [Halosimplex litoreum]|uniref:Cupin domain-containing protein n=1 Tax=Halosimplex litoreum TaxID=1198301 RepID=A0A7T3FZ83_9EURY|nr:cupin domain-containing protein [Halosimplex litoreum]QPV63362.1 cupin domain-containing protein [Halosimplex litoreum]
MSEVVHLPDREGDGRGVLFGGAPKTVRLSLDAGDRVPPHQHPGTEIVCYVVDGALDVTLGDETVDLVAGDAARFSGDRDISPRAREDSVALLVLAEG